MRLTVIFAFCFTTFSANAGPLPPNLRNPNLVVNGSFEDGPKNALLVALNPTSQGIKGWTVTRGQIDYVGPFWEHQDGNRSVDLHGSPGFGGIQQTISTLKNVKYELTFYLTSTPGCAKPKKSMAVAIDGAMIPFHCDSTGKSRTDWQKQTLTFTATDHETTIEFYTLETEDGNCGPGIDTVCVKRAK
jgi:choice-of-anchor C domain-containing protein